MSCRPVNPDIIVKKNIDSDIMSFHVHRNNEGTETQRIDLSESPWPWTSLDCDLSESDGVQLEEM